MWDERVPVQVQSDSYDGSWHIPGSTFPLSFSLKATQP